MQVIPSETTKNTCRTIVISSVSSAVMLHATSEPFISAVARKLILEEHWISSADLFVYISVMFEPGICDQSMRLYNPADSQRRDTSFQLGTKIKLLFSDLFTITNSLLKA